MDCEVFYCGFKQCLSPESLLISRWFCSISSPAFCVLPFIERHDREKIYERGCYGEEKDPLRGSCSCTNNDEVGGADDDAFNVDRNLWKQQRKLYPLKS